MGEAVYLGLGSNLGDREATLSSAADALSHIDAVAVLARSSIYESAAVGPDQPRFLNAAMKLACDLPPSRLLTVLQQIELDLGRVRRPGEPRWGPRPIDLDILLWGNRVIAEENLQIPHPQLHARRFALEPVAEIDPGAWHPILRVTVGEMLAKLASQDVVRYETARW